MSQNFISSSIIDREGGIDNESNEKIYIGIFGTKDDPVPMGAAAAWSRLFPKAVWPGEIPGLSPIGLGFSSDKLNITFS